MSGILELLGAPTTLLEVPERSQVLPRNDSFPVLPSHSKMSDRDFEVESAALVGFADIDESGTLKKKILKHGTGDKVIYGASVTVEYEGFLFPSGTKFDSSVDRGVPFEFTVGKGMVIEGWERGVKTMKEGEQAELICGPEYAYGSTGNPPSIPPDATLKFLIEVKKVRPLKESISTKITDAQKAKDEGNTLFKSGDFPAAIDMYTKALNIYADPSQILSPAPLSAPSANSDASGFDSTNSTSSTAGKMDEFFSLLNRVISSPRVEVDVDPDPTLYTNRALARMKCKEWGEAREDCTRALDVVEG
ncbi:Peptidyl-prolyl cis-trans isomerase FKBP4, partial [Quaeritorhiza haematococci]